MEDNKTTSSLTLKEAKEHAKKLGVLAANRWKHRRRMAYIALFSVLFVTYACLFNIPADRLSVLKDIVTWFYITMTSIIGAYLGFATLDDKWKTPGKKEDE